MIKNDNQYILPIADIERLLDKSSKDTQCVLNSTDKQCKIISFSKVIKETERKNELAEIKEFLGHYKIF